MPRRRPMIARSAEFLALDTARVQQQEARDCTVKALALAANVPYATAHAALAAAGRRPGRGASGFVEAAAYRALNVQLESVSIRAMLDRYGPKAANWRTITTYHPDKFNAAWADGETYLLYSRGHVTCVVNGVVHDWARGRSLRVYAIYRVVRKEA